jgi:hypothetical protein
MPRCLGDACSSGGVLDRGPWEPRWIQYADERFTDHMLAQSPSDRKVRTAEELAAAMADPPGMAPARILRIHESLLDEARRLWERGQP